MIRSIPRTVRRIPNRFLEINFGVQSNTFHSGFTRPCEDKYNWVMGAYYLHEDLKQNQPIFILLDGDKFFGGPGSADGIAFQAFDRSDQITDAYAAFGQGSYALTSRLKLTLGGRFTEEQRGFQYDGSVQFQSGGMDHFGPLIPLADTHESLTDSAFSWRAALDYRLAQGVLAYASVSTCFKSGGFNGSFLSLVPAEIALQLTPVRPEHVTSFEVGVKTTLFDNRLLFDAAAFYTSIGTCRCLHAGFPRRQARQSSGQPAGQRPRPIPKRRSPGCGPDPSRP